MEWNKLTTRPFDEEEKECYPGCAFMWDGDCPDIHEEVLVCVNGQDVYTDRWTEYDDGVGFENTYEEEYSTIYWMSFPEPPRR